LVPDLSTIRLVRHQVEEILGMSVLNITDSPMHGVNRLLKAVEDRVLAGFILLFISPLMLLIALSIKATSKGPVIYVQRRHGWDGRFIKVYKFRSMAVPKVSENRVVQARLNDPRVTPFGRFLRHTSLDELPQFINVLKGDMSIVGPRPHAIEHNEQYKERIDAYMQRHRVKPGITGWAQVQGWRGETDTLDKMRKRVEHDLYYIEHWSLGLDFKIILLTMIYGFVHRNAY
jgi:putative colanic acid biosynthesis UDP-glucose lipid carrier transferase